MSAAGGNEVAMPRWLRENILEIAILVTAVLGPSLIIYFVFFD
jgi:hypothetical protein